MGGGGWGQPGVSRGHAEAGHDRGKEGKEGEGAKWLRALHERPRRVRGVWGGRRLAHR